MMRASETPAHVAIACGGTGGHLFPGLAVAEQLRARGAVVSVLISPKEVDQEAVKSASGVQVFTLPAAALQRGSRLAFVRGFFQSWRASRTLFKRIRPAAVLAMGGFTAAPPVLAGKSLRAKTFLHESNTIPGRANRWLARWVNEAFVGFPQAKERLAARVVTVTGTPVRAGFKSGDVAASRVALGLDPLRPVVLVMGGSQGASGVNEMIAKALPLLARYALQWQWLHLTGPNDVAKMQQAYAAHGMNAVVRPFLVEMELALNAASVAVSRSGASSLAEIAALRLPALLVPYPTAADNHQWHNARAFEETGAALLLEQRKATPEKVSQALRELMEGVEERKRMKAALAQWHAPQAALTIAEKILQNVSLSARVSEASARTEMRETSEPNRAALESAPVA